MGERWKFETLKCREERMDEVSGTNQKSHDITLGQSWEESNHAYQEEERHKKGSVNVRRGEQRGLRVQRNRFDKLVKQ